MTAEGLVIDEVPPELDCLSEFERMGGSLVDGQSRISKKWLQEIAEKLDSAGINLKDQLQPKEREMIAAENRKRKTRAIHSFSSAIADPRFVRMVRRALYRAREKYKEALACSNARGGHHTCDGTKQLKMNK
jgi:hypothetical protein